MKNKTIGLVLPSYPAYSETFFHSKIQGLEKNGYKVLLFISNRNYDKDTKYKIRRQFPIFNKLFLPIIMFFVIFSLFILKTKSLIKFIKLEKESNRITSQIIKNIYINAHILLSEFDVLHFGFATMSIGKENVAKSKNAKMAVSFRGFDISIYPLKNKNCYDLLWKKIDCVHTISNDLYQEALNLGLSPKIPMYKITPAINTEYFDGKVKKIDKKNLKILTVARVHWKKGLDYTLHALSELDKQNFNFEYTVVGTGNDIERLKFMAYQLGILEKVDFVGKKSHDEIKKFMEKSDMYIQSSVQEGFCNAVLEAQSMGLLCIVSNAQGLSENVLNNKTGWVVDSRDSINIFRNIQKILTLDDNELNDIRVNAINRVKNEFDINLQINKFLTFYKGIINNEK